MPFSLSTGLYALIDVPLGPDAYEPTHVVPAEVSYVVGLGGEPFGLPYHEAIRRAPLEYDRAASTGHTSGGTPVAALAVGPVRCTPGAVISVEGALLWALPQDPATVARVSAAAATCPEFTFQMTPRTWLSITDEGSKGCVEGSWQVLSRATDPPTVLWERAIDVCREGPHRVALPYNVVAEPTTVDASSLAVRFQGRAEVRCDADSGPGLNELAFDTRAPMAPVLSWDCWPGWSP